VGDAINGLMFEVTSPDFRPLNANLMLFTTQAGFFLGPVLGGALVVRWGYHGYFLFSIGLAMAAVLIGILLAKSSRLFRGRP
jgi:MFS family permease